MYNLRFYIVVLCGALMATPLMWGTQLHDMIAKGEIARSKEVLNEGADVNEENSRGYAPLHIAASHGYKEIVDLLMQSGANVGVQDRWFRKTPLHTAAACGHVVVARQLLQWGVKVNMQDYFGDTPLHCAAARYVRGGNIDMIKLLIQHGAHIDMSNSYGDTPLHKSAFIGCIENSGLLLRYGANADIPNCSGETPLYYVGLYSRGIEMAKLLIQHGARADRVDNAFRTPLSTCISSDAPKELVELLIQHGANVQYIGGNTLYLQEQLEKHYDISQLITDVQAMHRGRGSGIVKRGSQYSNKLKWLNVAIGQGLWEMAEEIISNYLGDISSKQYADLQFHVLTTYTRTGDPRLKEVFHLLCQQYDTLEYQDALVDMVWTGIKNNVDLLNFVSWILNKYPDACRIYCDSVGNTILHIAAAKSRLNSYLPYIAILTMQNINHNPRNNANETPVMCARESGNDTGVEIIHRVSRIRNILSPDDGLQIWPKEITDHIIGYTDDGRQGGYHSLLARIVGWFFYR